MKILVPVKQVADPYAPISLLEDGSGVDLTHARMTLNPFDEVALEEAVQLQEKGTAKTIVAVTVGDKGCAEVLRTAMAIGADRAIHLKMEGEIQPLAAAKALASVAREERADLILMGKKAIDDEANQTGQILAGLLGWPQATFAARIDVGRRTATVEREIDAGREIISVDLPAVVTTDLHLNTPRYPTLHNLLKAKKMQVETRPTADLGLDLAPRLRTVSVHVPKRKRKRVLVNSAEELLEHLHQRGIL